MAFIENHDTDRYLGNGKDSTALKQAYALLLTMKRIPQLYYGTEILMNGTKTETDGNVRQDFPGGFPGDKVNKFTNEGRTKARAYVVLDQPPTPLATEQRCNHQRFSDTIHSSAWCLRSCSST